jgi:hypothetical protein
MTLKQTNNNQKSAFVTVAIVPQRLFTFLSLLNSSEQQMRKKGLTCCPAISTVLSLSLSVSTPPPSLTSLTHTGPSFPLLPKSSQHKTHHSQLISEIFGEKIRELKRDVKRKRKNVKSDGETE